MSRMSYAALLIALGIGAGLPTNASAQIPNLGTAETFGVLAGTTVTNTGSTAVAGDVGVGPGGDITGTAIVLTAGGDLHEGDAVAAQAQLDAAKTYSDLEEMTCTSNLTGQNLGGKNLTPGVYCFNGDASLFGAPLTLSGTGGSWIFVIAGDLTTAAAVMVTGSTLECNGSNVFWVVADDVSIGTGTAFVGNVLAQMDVTLGSGVEVDGRILALDPTSTVTLNTNEVSACSGGELLPLHAPVKVTGGGQINVPDPTSPGIANYGFNAKPEGSSGTSGHLNYSNHVTGLHVNGTVTDIDVVTLTADGTPDMVRFSGTCRNSPTCTFSVVVEDNGEPATNDRFGIVVQGSEADERTPHRVVRNGNIQVHLSLTTTINAETFRPGDVMSVSASLTPGKGQPPMVDAYLVLRMPNGQLLSWIGNGFVPGLAPLARNVRPVNFRAVIARLSIPAITPTGAYTWLSGTTAAGTLNLLSEIAEQPFTITR